MFISALGLWRRAYEKGSVWRIGTFQQQRKTLMTCSPTRKRSRPFHTLATSGGSPPWCAMVHEGHVSSVQAPVVYEGLAYIWNNPIGINTLGLYRRAPLHHQHVPLWRRRGRWLEKKEEWHRQTSPTHWDILEQPSHCEGPHKPNCWKQYDLILNSFFRSTLTVPLELQQAMCSVPSTPSSSPQASGWRRSPPSCSPSCAGSGRARRPAPTATTSGQRTWTSCAVSPRYFNLRFWCQISVLTCS